MHNSERQTESLDALRQLAEQGDAEAQYQLGMLYRTKEYLHYKEASRWLLKAAEQGHPEAQNAAGEMLREGKKIQRNLKEAFKWFSLAAEQGDATACYNLAKAYGGGEGCKRNADLAMHWFQKAVEQGEWRALYYMGMFWYDKDIHSKEAEEYFYKYSEHDNEIYPYIINMYRHCPDKVYKWTQRAAEHGSSRVAANAQYQLGVFHEKGISCEQNMQKAIEWYRKSAAAGNKDAQEALKRWNDYMQKEKPMEFYKHILDILDKQEARLEKLIEEKQIELIHHPERRDKVMIILPIEGPGTSCIYIYKEDTPMSVFREVAQLTFFLYYPYKYPPKECLLKCVKYLRMLPEDIQEIYLYAYHKQAARIYSGKKADYHLRQAIKYKVDDYEEPEEIPTLQELLEKWQKDSNTYLAVLMKILSFILSDRDKEHPDNFYEWNRKQYELIEKSLDEAIALYGENESYPSIHRAYFYFCQSIYYRQTCRYTLAEKALQKAKELLPSMKEDEMEDFLLENVKDKLDAMDRKVQIAIENFMTNETYDDDEEEEDEEYTFDELYELAEEGNADAQFEVALAYEYGNGVTANPRIAFEWMWMAAHNNNLSGMNNLGSYYSNGIGVEQNDVEAFKWYKLAAEEGDAYAQYNLAIYYSNGKGVDADEEEAMRWMRKAAEQGIEKAINVLKSLE